MSGPKRSLGKSIQRNSSQKRLFPLVPAQRRAWIIYELRVLGISPRELADKEGVSPQAISASAMGNGSSHLQAVLADTLGVPIHELFPEHFDSSGNRLTPTRQPNRNQKRKT